MSIREEMRIKELQYAEERKKASERAEKILDKRKEFQKGFNKALKNRKNYIRDKYNGLRFDKINRPDKEDFSEINSGEIMTETSGYIPISEQVRRFERAGENLKEMMSQYYDFGTKDIDKDGFSERLVAQYPDNIEAFQLVENAQLAALGELINEDKNYVEPEQEKAVETAPEAPEEGEAE